MQDEIIVQQQRFFSLEDILQLDYFQEGKQFANNKQIRNTINNIINNSEEVCITKGTLLYSEGDRADYSYFLIEGSVIFLAAFSEFQCFRNKQKFIKMADVEKSQMIANKLGIQSKQIKFNIHQLCQGNSFNYRVFRQVFGKTVFGVSEMIKSGIRAFTAITTDNVKVLKLPKKNFQSSCCGYEQKRQDFIITPMCKHLLEERGKQFIFNIFPSMIMDRINFHEIIYNEGDFPFAFYFIVKGEVETFKKYCQNKACINLRNPQASNSIYIPIRRIQSGQFFGIQQFLLRQSVRQFSVKATQQSQIFKIDAKRFNNLIEDYPDIKVNLTKYIKQLNNNKIKYCQNVYENIKNQFKANEQIQQEQDEKIIQKIYEQAFEKIYGNNKLLKRISGFAPNIKHQFKSTLKEQNHRRHLSFSNQTLQDSDFSFITSVEKSRNQSTQYGRSPRAHQIIDNDIKLDQKAHKKAIIKMGIYNIQNKKNVFKTTSAIKNSFEPIIDEIVRRHNTFLTKLDAKKRKSFVAQKFRSVVDSETKSKSLGPINAMYKTWTVRSMKNSIRKHKDYLQQTIKKNSQTHHEKMSKFQGVSWHSTSRISQKRQLSAPKRSSSGNKIILVNHMMKPIIYYRNN